MNEDVLSRSFDRTVQFQFLQQFTSTCYIEEILQDLNRCIVKELIILDNARD